MNKIFISALMIMVACLPSYAQIPILNSNPSEVDKVLYLDFDGQVVSGTSWNNGNTVNAAPSTVSNAAKIEIWKRVSEDYRPFDVNVTTDVSRFNNAQANRRMRIIFTPTSSWYGNQAGGVAFVNSFAWGGNPGTPCWVFENMLNYSSKSMSEAAAHEAGHTLSLRHQSRYNSSCVKTAEYHTGWGSGVTSWAPIMGVGYSRNVTIWHNGPNSNGCNVIQNDHGNAGITGMNFLNYLPDDAGGTFASAKFLTLASALSVDSGIITQPTDVDAYKFTFCETRYISINAQPFALDTINYSGANLDIKLHIFDAAGNLLAGDTSLTKLNALSGLTLAPGSYYFTIDGGHSNNYGDYGSLGKYYLRIKTSNPPGLSSDVITSTICGGESATLQAVPTGTVASYSWSVSGSTSFTSSLAAPSSTFGPGMHTITLLVANSTYSGCPVTATMDVIPVPSLAISGGTVICPPQGLTLLASGAQTYTWSPTNSTGAFKVVTETSPLAYTVTGSNGFCTNTTAVTVSVNPSFTLGFTTSKTITCKGDTVTLAASGANNYTLSPGSLQNNPVVITPGISANYYLTGRVGSCEKTTMLSIIVVPQPTITLNPSTGVACVGDTIQITASGVSNYTFQPGNTANKAAEFIAGATTVYSVTGYNNPLCQTQATTEVKVITCQDPVDTTITTSIDRHKAVTANIFPNPAQDQITVESEDGSFVTITGIHGSLLYAEKNSRGNNVINCGGWARGLYFVQIRSLSGHIETKKILLE